MTSAQRTAAWTLAALVGGGLAVAWACGWLEPELVSNPWVTLRGRRRRGRGQAVFIDDDGRIQKGLPEKYRGIFLRDLTMVGRHERQIKAAASRRARQLQARMPGKFRNKDIALRELLDANPQLRDFLEVEWGQGSSAYKAWRGRGRRGVKPQLQAFDGRLDAINYGWDLHGPRAVGSWLEAVYETIPATLRWDDFTERLPVLEEATGLRLSLPEPAMKRAVASGDVEQLEEGTELEIEDVYRRARTGAALELGELLDDDVAGDVTIDDVPF